MDAQPFGASSGEQMQPSAQFRACPEDQELVSADDTLPLARPASDGSMEAAVTAAQAEAVPPELASVLVTGAVLLAPRHLDGSAAAPEVRGAPILLRGGLGRRALAAGRRIGTALTVEQSRSDTATRPLPPRSSTDTETADRVAVTASRPSRSRYVARPDAKYGIGWSAGTGLTDAPTLTPNLRPAGKSGDAAKTQHTAQPLATTLFGSTVRPTKEHLCHATAPDFEADTHALAPTHTQFAFNSRTGDVEQLLYCPPAATEPRSGGPLAYGSSVAAAAASALPSDEDMIMTLLPDPMDGGFQQPQQHSYGGASPAMPLPHAFAPGSGFIKAEDALFVGSAQHQRYVHAPLPAAALPPPRPVAKPRPQKTGSRKTGAAIQSRATAHGGSVATCTSSASLASLRAAYLTMFGRETTSNNRQWLIRRIQGGAPPGGSSSSPHKRARAHGGGASATSSGSGAVHTAVGPAGDNGLLLGGATQQHTAARRGNGVKRVLTPAELISEASTVLAAAHAAAAAATNAAALAADALDNHVHAAADTASDDVALAGTRQHSPKAESLADPAQAVAVDGMLDAVPTAGHPNGAAAAAAVSAQLVVLPALTQNRGEGKRAVKPNRQFAALDAIDGGAMHVSQQHGRRVSGRAGEAKVKAAGALAVDSMTAMRHAHSSTTFANAANGVAIAEAQQDGTCPPLPAPPMATAAPPRVSADTAAQLTAAAISARHAARLARAAADDAIARDGAAIAAAQNEASPRRIRPTTTAGRAAMKRVRDAEAASKAAEAAASMAEAVAAAMRGRLSHDGGFIAGAKRAKKPRLLADFVMHDGDGDAARARAHRGGAGDGNRSRLGVPAGKPPRSRTKQARANGAYAQQHGGHGVAADGMPLFGGGGDEIDDMDDAFLDALVSDAPLPGLPAGALLPARHPYQQAAPAAPGSPYQTAVDAAAVAGSDAAAALTPPMHQAGDGTASAPPLPHTAAHLDVDDMILPDLYTGADTGIVDEEGDDPNGMFAEALQQYAVHLQSTMQGSLPPALAPNGSLGAQPRAGAMWQPAPGMLPSHGGGEGSMFGMGGGGHAAFAWAVPAVPHRPGDAPQTKRQSTKKRSLPSLTPRKSYKDAGAGGVTDASPAGAAGGATNGGRKSKQHNPWALAESEALVEGVALCGGGRWADIKKLGFPAIEHRSAVDLKDKVRQSGGETDIAFALPSDSRTALLSYSGATCSASRSCRPQSAAWEDRQGMDQSQQRSAAMCLSNCWRVCASWRHSSSGTLRRRLQGTAARQRRAAVRPRLEGLLSFHSWTTGRGRQSRCPEPQTCNS